MKKQQGFTLIEVIIYLALFTILMGGMVTAAYSVFESSDRNQTKIMVQEEGDFLVSKINWALSGAKSVNVSNPKLLSVEKWDETDPVIIELLGTDLIITRAGNPPFILNNSNVEVSNNAKVSDSVFVQKYDSDSNKEYIRADFTVSAKTLNGMIVYQDFFMVKYLRK